MIKHVANRVANAKRFAPKNVIVAKKIARRKTVNRKIAVVPKSNLG
jgi:hypothetical protein